MVRCIDACKKNACPPDVDLKQGCVQMYSCSHACKMRQLGIDEQSCKNNCNRDGESGCSPTVANYQFELCATCNRNGCPAWPTVDECHIGCTGYGK